MKSWNFGETGSLGNRHSKWPNTICLLRPPTLPSSGERSSQSGWKAAPACRGFGGDIVENFFVVDFFFLPSCAALGLSSTIVPQAIVWRQGELVNYPQERNIQGGINDTSQCIMDTCKCTFSKSLPERAFQYWRGLCRRRTHHWACVACRSQGCREEIKSTMST